MAAGGGGGGERGRSWFLSKEEIERGSPSSRDGVGAAMEDELRATYCSFLRDVGVRLQLPQITIATAIVLCHRFYLHQSHAKNEWQTVATACIFLASKIEDMPCPLQRVVIVAYETMYRKDPDAARRIYQKELLEKRKALILAGETLLLSTIRFDFNIQHPYEPLKLALKNLGISQKEVKQVAVNFINDTFRTTLVIQFKPHYIAAGSLSLAAKFHNVRLPSEKGKVWWHQFDVAPQQLKAVIQQMTELFMRRNPCPMGPAIRPPVPIPVEKQQTISFPDPVLKYTYSSRRGLSRPTPAPTPVERQQIISTSDPVLRHTYSSWGGLSRPTPAPTPTPTPTPTQVKKQQIISTLDPVLRHTHPSRTSLISNNFDREASRCMHVDSLAHHNSTVSSARNSDHKSLGTHIRHGLNSTGIDGRSEKQSSRATLKTDHSLNSTGIDGRWSEKLSSRAALKTDHSLNSTGIDGRWSEKLSSRAALKVDHSLNSTEMGGRWSEKQLSRAALKADVYHVCSIPKDTNATGVANLIRQKRRIQEAGEHPAPVDKFDRGAWMGRQFRSMIVVETKSSPWKKQKV